MMYKGGNGQVRISKVVWIFTKSKKNYTEVYFKRGMRGVKFEKVFGEILCFGDCFGIVSYVIIL